MSNQTNKIAQAHVAFQHGKYAIARDLLVDCTHPQAAHLRGLVERRLGHFEAALAQLDAALTAEPNNPEIHHNQSLVLLDLQRPGQALEAVSKAVQLKPDFVAAQRTLGRALRTVGLWDQALVFYRDFLNRHPADVPARYGLAMAELETGLIEPALDRFEALINDGASEGSIHFMHGRAALEAGDVGRARQSLLEAHRLAPTALSLRELGRLFWMQQDTRGFHDLLSGPFETPDMTAAALQLLRQSGADIEQLTRFVEGQGPANADHESTIAQACVDLGNAEAALQHAHRSLRLQAGHDGATAAKISAYLMLGESAEALKLSRQKREEQPNGQQWIAYESTALRLLRSPKYRQLVDLDRHIQVYSLPLPEGYNSLEAFNRVLEKSLDRLQLFSGHPIDQSLRHGSQTARDLRSVGDPVIQDYLRALDAPIRDYMSKTGDSPEHPLSRRNTGDFTLSGCWSVQLTGRGHHVNHMHPEGWISSAYYVRVPVSKPGSRSGWIHFGQPPFKTQPELEPQRWIEPRSGMLVLFPSYLWHGTEPIDDGEVRVTAPFDAVPR